MRMIVEGKDQKLVQTAYGIGLVRRTRHTGDAPINEIELDWNKSTNQRPTMLYSTTNFPSSRAEIDSEVITAFGRGKVIDIRADKIIVVQISSWRLARRSLVTCYLSEEAVAVVKPRRIFEMNVYEKIEHAQKLKEDAARNFSSKNYYEALQLYSKAVDAVRYIQHKRDSSNEARADLLLLMITCCNNAGTCSLLLNRWEETYKFGKNAIVLLDAFYEKRKKSKILKLLYDEKMEEQKIFGTWKVKGLTLIARGLAEKHDTEEAISNLKKALDVIALYKKEGDPMYQQLLAQEKQLRKLYNTYRQQIKVQRKKEKQRAMAMFKSSPSEEPKALRKIDPESLQRKSDANPDPNSKSTSCFVEAPSVELNEICIKEHPKKELVFEDRSKPGDIDPYEDMSFFSEHKEALLLLVGGFVGSAALFHLTNKRR